MNTKQTFSFGESVLITPEPGDIFIREFIGTVHKVANGYAMVKDQFGYYFECKIDQVKKIKKQ